MYFRSFFRTVMNSPHGFGRPRPPWRAPPRRGPEPVGLGVGDDARLDGLGVEFEGAGCVLEVFGLDVLESKPQDLRVSGLYFPLGVSLQNQGVAKRCRFRPPGVAVSASPGRPCNDLRGRFQHPLLRGPTSSHPSATSSARASFTPCRSTPNVVTTHEALHNRRYGTSPRVSSEASDQVPEDRRDEGAPRPLGQVPEHPAGERDRPPVSPGTPSDDRRA